MRLRELLSNSSSGLRVVAACYTRVYFRPHHFLVDRHSEPPYFLSYDIQNHPSQFCIQSHYLFSVSTFRATIPSQFRHLESPSLLSLSVQSHHIFSVWHSEPPSILGYGVRGHHLFIARHSKSSYLFSYDIQSRPSQFDIQRCRFSIMAFRAFIFFSLAFRATIPSQFGCSEPPSLFSLAFKATISF